MGWNTDTNKATVTIPNNLTVGETLTVAGTNVMTELNAINTELGNKVDNVLVNAPLAWELDPELPLVSRLGIISGSYATPTYVNTELAKKANSLEVYLKTETYNKTEVNDKFTDIIGRGACCARYARGTQRCTRGGR